jgi:hypothetical protein
VTLPAHRYRDRVEERKQNDRGHTWAFDFDETITKAPKQLARIANGLKALGDTVVVVTGNEASRKELEQRLKGFGFPFDGLIQYEDDETDGLRRAAILKQLNAWGAFDDRTGRSPMYAQICPHFFLVAEPSEENEEAAKGAKHYAKQVIKEQLSGGQGG